MLANWAVSLSTGSRRRALPLATYVRVWRGWWKCSLDRRRGRWWRRRLKSLWLDMLRRLLTPIDRVPFSTVWIGVRSILVALREAKCVKRKRCRRKSGHTESSLRFQTDSVTPLTVRVILLSDTKRPSGVTVLRDTWLYTRVRPRPGFDMSSNPRSNGKPAFRRWSSKKPRPR
jgi:hypothetical protein